MQFHIKDNFPSKCDSCVHCMKVIPANRNVVTKMCRLLGNQAMTDIKECSHWLPHIRAGCPEYLLHQALAVEVKTTGFKSTPMPDFDKKRDDEEEEEDNSQVDEMH